FTFLLTRCLPHCSIQTVRQMFWSPMRSIGIEVLAHSYQPTFLRDLTGLSSPLVVIEESLELFGGSVMLWAAYHRAGLTFNISPTESIGPVTSYLRLPR